MNLITATPAEIDYRIADIITESGPVESRADYDRLTAMLSPYEAEYARRGGWTRVIVVPGGHVHRWTGCHTLYWNTQQVWLPEWSGCDEGDIVEAAGDRACTVCYPSAPVAVLSRPSRIATPDEQAARDARAAEAAQRDAKATAQAAKAITNPDGSPLRVDSHYAVIKTERTAQIEYVDAIVRAREIRANPDLNQPHAASLEADAEVILTALAHKRGTTVEDQRAALASKVDAKAKRNAKEAADWLAANPWAARG